MRLNIITRHFPRNLKAFFRQLWVAATLPKIDREQVMPPTAFRLGSVPKLAIALLLVWSIGLGCGISVVSNAAELPGMKLKQTSQPRLTTNIKSSGTVDPVTTRYQLGQQLYLENCASCHIGVPPEVFPTETWREILQNEQHYGVELKRLTSPSLIIVWNYLRNFSRPQPIKEAIPARFIESRYFKALHPKVNFKQPVDLGSCVTCHPASAQFNFRNLTPEWENSP